MGNEQSGGGGEPMMNSPSTSTGGGGVIPASFSFLATKKRNSVKNASSTVLAANAAVGQIVVVNEGNGTGGNGQTVDPSADPDWRRLKEVPHFMPLLRSVIPGYRDLPEVHQKIDSRPIFKSLDRLQHHFRQCAETVTTEQGRIFAHIVEIDHLALSMLKKSAQASKRIDTLGAELRKADAIEEQLENSQVLFHELARCADALNGLLPREEQLPPLQIAFAPIMEERRQRHHFVREAPVGRQTMAPDGMEMAAKMVVVEVEGRVSECRVVDEQ